MRTPRTDNGIAGVRFPLEGEGIALRGLFIVDPGGVIQYLVTHILNVGRLVGGTLRVQEAITSAT